MPRYTVAVFDMDGTILNTLDDMTVACNYTLGRMGMPLRTIDEIRMFVGNGIPKLVERIAPAGTDEETLKKMLDIFMPFYSAHSMDKTGPYAGIPELLKKLKDRGIKLACVSNKADAAMRKLCDGFFNGLFDDAEGERAGVNKKPAPDMVWAALEKMGAKKEDAVYIGDSNVDYETAVNSGLDCISVSWGFRSRKFLEDLGSKCIVDSPEEVFKVIMNE
ncbi:MAG: HAD family hydrolase [Lachnospiraceae bacterium]|nr:HAD family hydrolase [Lachnospiraceae bacterium]